MARDSSKKSVNEAETLSEVLARQDPAAMQALSANMTQAMIESQELLAELMGRGPDAITDVTEHPVTIGSGAAMANVGRALAQRPERVVDANLALWQGYMELWQDLVSGKTVEPGRDRRFADPEWTANPVFDFMRRSYELNAQWLMSVIDQADDLTQQDRRKARFLARQTVEAFAPTNYFATNPAVLKAMIETGGDSVVKGIRQAREDIKRGHGKLMISQTDATPFKLGENVATAPGQVVFRNELIELIQYAPTTETVYQRPLLIFPPWINKFYILDLREENSMIRWLVDKGLTVFVVSWRSADEETKDFGWDDYVSRGILPALEKTLEATGADDINAVGYCIGGTLLSSALAYMAKQGDERIASATFFASQSDFEEAGELLVFTDSEAIDEITDLIESHGGIMPGETMGETFNWLRPVDLVWRYVVDNYMLGRKPKAFDLLYWNADQTNIPAPTHITYLRDLYGHNALSRGQFQVLGETVNLGDITIPITTQASRDDHICPYGSIYRTAQRFGGPVRFVLAGSGHIAGVINHPDAQKYQHWLNEGPLPDKVDDWMAGAEEHPGSWWPSWWAWLEPQSGEQVPAREPEDKGLGAAPGFYVTCRLEDLAAARKAGKVLRPPPVKRKPRAKSTGTRKTKAEIKPDAVAEAAAKPPTATTRRKPAARKRRATSARKPARKT